MDKILFTIYVVLKGMETTRHVELLMIERGCQICKQVMRYKIY
jgi:hypothetical protein